VFTCAAPAAGVGCCEAHVTLALRRGAASRSRFALCAGPVRPRRRRAPRAQSTHARAQTTAQHRTANRSGARTATRWAYSSVAPPPPGVSERPHSTWPASTKLQAPTTLGCDAHRRQGRAGAPALPPPTFQVLHQQQRRPPGGGDGSARSAERRRQRGQLTSERSCAASCSWYAGCAPAVCVARCNACSQRGGARGHTGLLTKVILTKVILTKVKRHTPAHRQGTGPVRGKRRAVGDAP
jgi:hypothetical protein